MFWIFDRILGVWLRRKEQSIQLHSQCMRGRVQTGLWQLTLCQQQNMRGGCGLWHWRMTFPRRVPRKRGVLRGLFGFSEYQTTALEEMTICLQWFFFGMLKAMLEGCSPAFTCAVNVDWSRWRILLPPLPPLSQSWYFSVSALCFLLTCQVPTVDEIHFHQTFYSFFPPFRYPLSKRHICNFGTMNPL